MCHSTCSTFWGFRPENLTKPLDLFINSLVFCYLIKMHSHRIYHVRRTLFVDQYQEFDIGNTIPHVLWEPLLQYRRLAQARH
jgi:hypothetical protein